MHFLKKLQEEEFRQSCKDVNFTNWLHRQQFFHWFYKDRLQKAVEKSISQWVLVYKAGVKSVCSMIRSTNMNALTLEMVESLNMSLNGPEVFVLCGDQRVFSVGDDYLWLYNNPRSINKYCAEKARCLIKLKTLKSLCVVKGNCMGTGAGLALSCQFIVGTFSSQISFPENTFGTSVDCAALFYLKNLPTGLALYLCLTGSSIKGSDLLFRGLITHFVQEENIERLIEESKNCADLKALCEKYAYTPQSNTSQIYEHLSEIEEIFGKISSIEGLYEKLTDKETEFRKHVLHLLSSQCPLSLNVTLKAFNRCKGKSFEQCVEIGYNLNVQMMQVNNYNFSLAVFQKLIQKSKSSPQWQPNHYSLVTPSLVNPLFSTLDIPES